MDINSILQIGAQLFQSKLSEQGQNLDLGAILPALTGLLSDGSGKVDIGSLVSNMDAGDMLNIAQSWLGNGSNEGISANQLTQILGQNKITDFASQLSLNEDQAISGLQEAIPNIVDKSSNDGSLLDMVGGVSGALNLAGKLFGR
ncbi:YidB family protein [uncultured Pseudoteredinibacter sp.]|uniref:YidB family protein n=1 Tax=uncultured Pseudoteredinibacter sp. TaxID=1641701 RepID=UPI0026210D2D|nr:YidB family protein [uncultured Pseudoteredinibacter sp.]